MINEQQAKKFCKEDISKIKNYDLAIADKTQTWHCHHMTETWWHCTAKDLIENKCYYNRKACELVFLTPSEHRRLHNMNMSEETRRKKSEALKGRVFSEESRRKMSESKKGKKRKPFSEETRRKLSEAKKGQPSPMKGRTLSEETRKKISAAAKNISDETRKKRSEALKGKQRSEESRIKMSEAAKRRWANKQSIEA